MITLELLQALLSSDTARRQAAEAHFQALSVHDRVLSWPSVWNEVTSNNSNNNNDGVAHLTAVLWRRDILNSTNSDQMAASLWQALSHIFTQTTGVNDKIRTAIGHCWAEVVAKQGTPAALEQTLRVTQAMLSKHPGPVLELYQALGQAVPRGVWTSASLAFCLQGLQALTPPSSSSNSFCTASTLAAAHHLTIQVVDTLAALPLSPQIDNTGRLQAILQTWLAATTDVDTLAHIFQVATSTTSNSEQFNLSDTFWQLAWRQVQPHASTEPCLVCQALEPLAEVLTDATEVAQALQLLVQILAHAVDDDTTDWSTVEWLEQDSYETDHDDDGLAAYATDILHVWLFHHGQTALSALWAAVQSQSHDNWRSVWTTVTVWQVCLAALPVAMEPYATTVFQGLSQILSSAKQQHVRVRHQAWQTLAGLLETYPAVLTDKDGLAQALRHEWEQGTNPRVTAAACRVIVCLCTTMDGNTNNDEEEEQQQQYVWNANQLQVLLQGLTQGPLSPRAANRLVVVRALTAVAALSRCAPLGKFYGPTMALLLDWSAREASVTANALEAASLVAQALVQDEQWADAVRNDAQALMERLLPVLQPHGSNTSTTTAVDREPLLLASARLAFVLEERFAPYLPVVLAPLLEKIMAQDEFEINEGDADGLDQTRRGDWQQDGTTAATISLPGGGLTKVTVHTSQIEEKAQAIRALYELLVAIPNVWNPYFESTWLALEPTLSYKFHADIRTTAAQSMAALVEAGFESGQQVWSRIPRAFVTVSRQLINEANTEAEDMFALADSLSDMLYSSFSRKDENEAILLQHFTTQVATEIVQNCGMALQKCLERRSVSANQMAHSSSPDDKAFYQEKLKEEQKLMTPLVDSIGFSLKIMGSAFAPLFEQKVAPLFGPFLTQNVDTRARWSAVCLFDDCIEHCGPQAAARFAPQLMPAVLSGMKDTSDIELQRVSIYGIAQMARRVPASILAPHADAIIPTLASIASEPKETGDAGVREYAVSALVSLVLFASAPFRGKFIKMENATKLLLDDMPLTEDSDEAKICSEGLCDLIEAGSVSFASFASSLIRVIGETLALVADEAEVASESTCARMTDILVHLQREGSSNDIQGSFANLSTKSQAAVQSAMQRYSYVHKNVVTP